MTDRTSTARLLDIVGAIERIRVLIAEISLDGFIGDWQRKWLVERGVGIISEASRHLTDELKRRHSDIPRKKVAGIGNVLRHDYGNIAAPIIWKLVQDDLPALGEACRLELELVSRDSS